MNEMMKRILSLVLCAVMLLGVMPVSAFATDSTGETTALVETAEVVAETTEAVVETTESVVETTETVVETTEAVTETTQPVVETTEPIVETTEAIVEETEANTEETEPSEPENTEETAPEETPVRKPVKKGMVVSKKEATGENTESVDAAIFFSDLHSYNGESKKSVTDEIFGTIAEETGLSFSSVTSIGDVFSSNSGSNHGDVATITANIRTALQNQNVTVNYTWSDHDRDAGIDNVTGLIYGDNGTADTSDDAGYYIYAISMSDMTTNPRYNTKSTFAASKLDDFTAAVENLDKSKPLFIASHMPLLDRRDDNGHAYEWYEVISDAAEEQDIIFLHGHNHNHDELADYYFANGDTMEIATTENKGTSSKPALVAKEVTLNFTHMSAGYMEPKSTTSYNSATSRMGVAIVAAIRKDTIQLTAYDKNGIYDGGIGEVNVTFDRKTSSGSESVQPVVTLQSIAVTAAPAKTEYVVGDTFDKTGLVVTATYSDGTTAPVEAAVSAPDMTTAGEKTVTVTFEEKTATFTITVAEPVVDEPQEDVPVADTNGTGITVTAPGVEAVAAAAVTDESPMAAVVETAVAGKLTDYVAYDINITGELAEGAVAVVSLPLPESITEPAVYYVSETGEMESKTVLSAENDYVTFETDHFSVYVLGNGVEVETESGNATVPGTETTTYETREVTIYKRVTAPTAGNAYLIVNSSNGTGYGLDGDTSGYATTAFSGGDNYYSSWDDATKTGTKWEKGSDTYLTADGAYLWTVGGSNNARTFTHGSTTLGVNQGGSFIYRTYSLAFSNGTSQAWSLSNNVLTENDWNRQLSCNSSGTWSVPASGSNIYFYEPVTVTEVTANTTGTPAKVYSVVGNNVTTVGNGTEKTVTLSSVLYETAGTGAPVDITAGFTGTVTYELVAEKSDANVVKGISGNTATLTGNIGTALVRVTYTYGDLTAWNEFAIIVTERPVNEYKQVPGGEQTIFRLTNTLTANKKYVIVNSNAAGNRNALSLASSSSFGTTPVTVIADAAGNYILAPADSAQWTYTNNKFQNVGTTSAYLRGRNGTGALRVGASNSDYTTWHYDEDYGLYITINNVLWNTYYTISTSFAQISASTTNRVYIYGEETISTADMFAILEGESEFTFPVNGYQEATVRDGIQVYTATDASGSNKTLTGDYELEGSINASVPGVYPVTVKYRGVVLGTVTVNITTDPSLQITENGAVVEEIIVRKNANVGDRVQLGVYAFDGKNEVEEPKNIIWSIDDEHAGYASVNENGQVTFKSNSCTFFVNASWEVNGKTLTDTVQITVSPSFYVTPNEGTNDFPEYPEPGGLRYDKTAEAVGNFSQTGVAQMELSMTGIPFGGPQKFDIVLLLDRSSSMKDGTRLSDTRKAASAFVEAVAKDPNTGAWTGHNIMVMDYYGGKVNQDTDQFGSHLYTENEKYSFTYTATYPSNTSIANNTITQGFQVIESQAELTAISTDLTNSYKLGNTNPSGTDYDHALQLARAALAKARAEGSTNKQFVVMMTDGVPTHLRYEGTPISGATHNSIQTTYEGVTTTLTYGTSANEDMMLLFRDGNQYKYDNRGPNYRYEYISGLLKNEGVTIYTVALGLEGSNSAWPSVGANDSITSGSIILNDIAGPAGETTRDTGIDTNKKDSYFFNVKGGDTAGLTKAFTTIAGKISEAATNIVVTDKINEDYTMIFGIPRTSLNDEKAADRNKAVAEALENQEFYIEVIKYPLDGDGKRDTQKQEEQVIRVYLEDSNGATAGGTYSAAKNAGGTDFEAVVFTPVEAGKKAYWEITGAGFVAGENDIIVTVGDVTYRFVETGSGTHNVTAGAYAFGNIDAKTNMSNDLVIVTPYFAYNAATRMLAWTCDKVQKEHDIALRYLLYLDNSATEIGTNIETEVGAHLTNDWAFITYTNHLDNECRQEFPKPQLTWNGAQVSYVFYLVDENGNPINKSGKIVDFAQATFVTDVFTESVVWNDTNTPTETPEGFEEGVAYLDAMYKAVDKLPEGYTLFDQEAYYELKVYEDHEGNVLDNYFIIEGTTTGNKSKITTKVYNTKAGTRYHNYGAYAAEIGNFTSDKTGTEYTATVINGFDFANTTVAFAVVWEKKLIPDTVVVDFGLDVLINVTQNDLMQNALTGISAEKIRTDAINTGAKTDRTYENAEIVWTDGHYAKIEDDNQIRFSQRNMEFEKALEFFYETATADFVESGTSTTNYMYSSVTVIPATTIYYEDSFVDLNTYKVNYKTLQIADEAAFKDQTATKAVYTLADGVYTRARKFAENTVYYERADIETPGWASVGLGVESLQDQDRPGESKISETLDADNNYGYDGAYENMSRYSLGSSARTTVNANTYATAEFDFYGTGFDVISVTSRDTGVLVVQVFDESGTLKVSKTVDTYYGYEKEGDVLTPVNRGALYQVPVIKVIDLPYGKYTAKLTASYYDAMNNLPDGSYDLYLDAIRIYDPTGNQDDTSNNAYITDGEAYPQYFEVRNSIIDAKTYDSLGEADTNADGVVFIDGVGNGPTIAEYTSYGPNNEVYLNKGQAIAFQLNATATKGEVAKVQLAVKTVGGTGEVEIYGVNADGTTVEGLKKTINTATDMYYDITDLNGKTVVIKSTGNAIVSITNIKCTYDTAYKYPVSMQLTQTNGVVTGAAVNYTDKSVATVKLGEKLTVTENEDGSKTYTYKETVNSREYSLTVKVAKANAGNAQNQKSTVETVSKLLTFSRTSVNAALATLNVQEPELPEESVPETTEPESAEPETTEPQETTEPEETEPEETQPESDTDKLEQALKQAAKQAEKIAQQVKDAAEKAVKEAVKTIAKLFSKWF